MIFISYRRSDGKAIASIVGGKAASMFLSSISSKRAIYSSTPFTLNARVRRFFSALSFVVYLLEIPIFAGTPASFLELDLSNVFVMLAGFMYGALPAFLVVVIKECFIINLFIQGFPELKKV